SSPIQLSQVVLDVVKKTTNNVPREVVKLMQFIVESFENRDPNDATERYILERVEAFESVRRTKFIILARSYFTNMLNDVQQMDQRTALSIMFQPTSQGNLHSNIAFTEPRFMDLGLVYRLKVAGDTKYKFLCPAASKALLEIYRETPLPIDKVRALEMGSATGEDFEEAFFRYVMWYRRVSFKTTDLVGNPKSDINIDAADFDMTGMPPTKAKENTFRRLCKDYSRFDFVYNRTFFQLSKSKFDTHDTDYSRISKAFDPPEIKVDNKQDNGKASRDAGGNQKETSTGSPK
ncbi:hypothetical protein BGZ49_005815, partial [Haplosporangium sp. Z 27]